MSNPKTISPEILEAIKNIDIAKTVTQKEKESKAVKYQLTNNLEIDKEYIYQKIKNIIKENLKYKKEIIIDQNLNDALLYTEDIVEIIIEIEKLLNINIPDETLYDWIDNISIIDISEIVINILNKNKNKYLSFYELSKLKNQTILAIDFFEAWTNQIKNTLLANLDIKNENTIWATYIDQNIFWPVNINPKDEISDSWIFYDHKYSIEINKETWLENSPRQRFAYRLMDSQEIHKIKK